MKIKIIGFAFCFLGSAIIPTLEANTNCECGEHATGITTFTVTGTNCCSDTPTDWGFEITYLPNGGVWQVDTETRITGTTAQNNCCNPS